MLGTSRWGKLYLFTPPPHPPLKKKIINKLHHAIQVRSDFVDNEGGHTKWRALFIHMNNEKISPCLVTMKVETGVNFFFWIGKKYRKWRTVSECTYVFDLKNVVSASSFPLA